LKRAFRRRSAINISLRVFDRKEIRAEVRMTDIWVLLLGAALGVGGTLAAYAIADALLRRRHRNRAPMAKELK
jgi:hypothetical protein